MKANNITILIYIFTLYKNDFVVLGNITLASWLIGQLVTYLFKGDDRDDN